MRGALKQAVLFLALGVTPAVGAQSPEPATPTIASVPRVVFPNTLMPIAGKAINPRTQRGVTALFRRGNVEHVATITGGGGGGQEGPQSLDVVVPDAVTPGRWELIIDVEGLRSAPFPVNVRAARPLALTDVSPPKAHPGQLVIIGTRTPPRADSQLELIDGLGVRRHLDVGIRTDLLYFGLPDDVAEGEATARVRSIHNGVERFTPPVKLFITAGPLPLKRLATDLMRPVAAGQWTHLDRDHEVEFELLRSDRIEVEFRQQNVAMISETTGPYRTHVRVPEGMRPGLVSVRTRSWIGQTASEWSTANRFPVLARPVPLLIYSIRGVPGIDSLWWVGSGSPSVAIAKAGQRLWVSGEWPVAGAAEVRVQLRGLTEELDLAPIDYEDDVLIELPSDIAPGDWKLMIGPVDGLTPLHEITTLRVM
jgi:hypothetical protein